MWTETTRRHYHRSSPRYASGLEDAEWALLASLLPPRRRLGLPRQVDLREIVNGIFYLLSAGCQWRALPTGFPPRSTVQGYFYRWRADGTWHRIAAAAAARAQGLHRGRRRLHQRS